MVNELYGETEGLDQIVIEWKGLNSTDNPNVEVGSIRSVPSMSPQHMFFLWNVLMYCCGNVTEIQNAVNHEIAMQGLLDVLEIVAFVGKDPQYVLLMRDKNLRLQYPADGSTVFRMVCDWLFQTLRDKAEEPYRKGIAIAFEALAKLFCCRVGGKVFQREELSLFYEFVKEGLKTEDLGIKSAIIMNIQRLFCRNDLAGRMLIIPDVMRACEVVLCGKMASTFPADLRRACVRIVVSLVSCGNHFGETVFKLLKLQIQRNLVKAVKAEVDTTNLQMLLWGIGVCVMEEVLKSKKVGSMFVHQMLNVCQQHATHPNVQYPPPVFVTLYEVLSMLSTIWPSLHANDDAIVGEILTVLSTQVEDQIKLLHGAASQYWRMICTSLLCIGDFCVRAAEVVMSNDSLLAQVVKAVDAGLNLRPLVTKAPGFEKVYRHSLHLLYVLTCTAAGFPGQNTYETELTVLPDEHRVIDGKGLIRSDFVRHYLFDNSHLLTLIEQPMNSLATHGLSLVSRSSFGRRMWDVEYLTRAPSPPVVDLQPLGTFKGSSSSGLIGHTQADAANDVFMGHHIPLDYEEDRPGTDKILRMMDATEKSEGGHRHRIMPGLNRADLCVKEDVPPELYETDQKFQVSRLFLAHMGFFHVGHDTFFQVVQGSEFEEFLSQLDASLPRETHQFSVLYIKSGQDVPQQFLENAASVSPQFRKFVSSLAWSVNLTDRNQSRFLGGLAQDGSSSSSAPYFADHRNEGMFHVLPKLPETEMRQHSLEENTVNIIWTDFKREFSCNVIPTDRDKVNIVIYPLQCGLFEVSIVRQSERDLGPIGPLQDGMLVSEKLLPSLVTLTALNASLAIKHLDPEYVTPFRHRLDKIDTISSNLKKGVTYDNLLATIFIVKRFDEQA